MFDSLYSDLLAMFDSLCSDLLVMFDSLCSDLLAMFDNLCSDFHIGIPSHNHPMNSEIRLTGNDYCPKSQYKICFFKVELKSS
jgi:hypothetical protein